MMINWIGTDELSKIKNYAVRIYDNSWIDGETNTNYVLSGLNDGVHSIEVITSDYLD